MRTRSFFRPALLGLSLLPLGLTACEPAGPSTDGIADAEPTDQVSYIIGRNFGESMRQSVDRDSVDLDIDLIMAAIREGYEGDSSRFSDEEMGAIMRSFQEDMRARQDPAFAQQLADRRAALAGNLAAADSFLTANADTEGLMTTESGMQYVVLEEGDGPMPTRDDVVEVNYEGSLINGDVFDSSYERGEPIQFPVTGVIPGWTEALQMMKVGSKYRLHIPPDLAYGERGQGAIPPNSLLIFDVELLAIEDQ